MMSTFWQRNFGRSEANEQMWLKGDAPEPPLAQRQGSHGALIGALLFTGAVLAYFWLADLF